MGKKLPAIRECEDSIDIDAKKGEWPYLRAMWGEDDDEKRVLALMIDSNEGGQIIGSGQGLAILLLRQKKAEALRDFLMRTV